MPFVYNLYVCICIYITLLVYIHMHILVSNLFFVEIFSLSCSYFEFRQGLHNLIMFIQKTKQRIIICRHIYIYIYLCVSVCVFEVASVGLALVRFTLTKGAGVHENYVL